MTKIRLGALLLAGLMATGCTSKYATLENSLGGERNVIFHQQGYVVNASETIYSHYEDEKGKSCTLVTGSSTMFNEGCNEDAGQEISGWLHILRRGDVFCYKHDHWLRNIPKEFLKQGLEDMDRKWKAFWKGLGIKPIHEEWLKKKK